MLAEPTSHPLLSMVAEKGKRLLGRALFTAAKLDSREEVRAQILAPLAVTRDQHWLGIGSELVESGLTQLQQDGVDLVFVRGCPNDYSKFGFAPAGIRGFMATYPILPKHADAWTVREISPGAIESQSGNVRCSRALDYPMYWQE